MTDESGTYMRQRQLTVTRSTKAEALQDAVAEIEYIEKTKPEAAKRLGQIREALNSKNVSYGELVELQSMVEYIDPSDAQLLEAAGA